MHLVTTGIFWFIVAIYFVFKYVPPSLLFAFAALTWFLRRTRFLPRLIALTAMIVLVVAFTE